MLKHEEVQHVENAYEKMKSQAKQIETKQRSVRCISLSVCVESLVRFLKSFAHLSRTVPVPVVLLSALPEL